MTELKELLSRIAINYSSISYIDWRDETQWFNRKRMRQIILGIEDDNVMDLIIEYISLAWYIAVNEGPQWDSNNEENSLVDETWEGYYDYRFCTKEDLPFPDDNGIETCLEEFKNERVKIKKLAERRNELNERIKKLEKPCPSVFIGTPKSFEINLENKTFDQLIEEKELLEREVLDCKKEILELRETNNEYERVKPKDDSQIRNEVISDFLEKIIEYAMNFPTNQNDKAEVIKELLIAKSFNGHIPSAILTPELKKRIMSIGRKEPSINVGTLKTDNLYDIHNNGEVKI